MSQAGVLSVSSGGGSTIETLTGNSGGAVPPTGFNIDVLGDNTTGINIVGNPGTSTLTVFGIQATTSQQGTVTLATNGQAIAGASTSTAVTPSSLAAKLGTQTAHSLAVFEGTAAAVKALGVATNGQLPIGSTGADPVLANITSTGGTVTITNGAGSINLEVTGGAAIDTINGDTGSISGATVTIKAGVSTQNCGSSVEFVNSGTTSTLNVTDASSNTIIGHLAGNGTISGNNNSGFGDGSLRALTSGSSNTAIGLLSLVAATSASANVCLGDSSGKNLLTGQSNTIIGPGSTTGAGSNYTSSESSNICINNNGVTAESHVIRIGTQGSGANQQNACFIAGIAGVTSVSSAVVAGLATGTGQLVQSTITAGTGISVTPAAGTITIATNGSSTVNTLTGNSGGAISPTAGNINTLGTGSITIAGSGSTLTTQLTGLTNHNVLLGAGTATITNVAPSATSGVPLISQGAAADPAFGTAVVAGGGTGATSFNINGVVISNTTTTGSLAALTLTDGQVVIGKTGSPPSAATLTPGAGIAITNGGNSITIAATGAGFTWSDTSGSFTAAVENGYFITAASTPTLPASPNEGDTIAFVVDTASTCTITGNTGQKIRIGAALSAAAGTAANNARGDTVELVYRSTGTTWFATSVIGTWTVT